MVQGRLKSFAFDPELLLVLAHLISESLPRRHELSQLPPYHLLRDIYILIDFPIVHRKFQAHEVREDRCGPGLRFYCRGGFALDDLREVLKVAYTRRSMPCAISRLAIEEWETVKRCGLCDESMLRCAGGIDVAFLQTLIFGAMKTTHLRLVSLHSTSVIWYS